MYRALKLATLALLLSALCSAQDLASFEKRVTVKTAAEWAYRSRFASGPTPLRCFRFYTNVDAGSVQDPMGKTGLAHMFEHMAFKGQRRSALKTTRRESGAAKGGRRIRRLYCTNAISASAATTRS